jgi:hypothetical protein
MAQSSGARRQWLILVLVAVALGALLVAASGRDHAPDDPIAATTLETGEDARAPTRRGPSDKPAPSPNLPRRFVSIRAPTAVTTTMPPSAFDVSTPARSTSPP